MSIDEFSAAVGAATDSVETSLTAIHAAKGVGEGLAGQLAALGLDDKTARTNDIAQRLEAEAAAAASALKDRLEELRQEVEGLRGALQGGDNSPRTATVPPPGSSTPAAPSFTPAGTWDTPPKRTFGNQFNADYEEWVKTENGGPAGDLEYRVMNPSTGRPVWFDARRIEDRGNGRVEYLLDAKGSYGQFVEKDGSDFKWFFRERGGRASMLDQAQRQADAAGGRPVEWWCADENVVDVMNEYFEDTPGLDGKIEAVYRPMPNDERREP